MSSKKSTKEHPFFFYSYKFLLPFSLQRQSFYFFFFFIFTTQLAAAQQSLPAGVIPFARQVIDTLTSPAFNGRGYVDSGDWKAAQYLKKELKAAGVQTFDGSYFQPYRLSTNVFPGNMKFEFAGKTLQAGTDFLVHAGAASRKGRFKTYVIKKSLQDTGSVSINKLISDLSAQRNSKRVLFIARDSFTVPQYQRWQQALAASAAFGAAAVVECSDKKLTWHASQVQLDWCQMQWKHALPEGRNENVNIDVQSTFKSDYATQNVIGYVRGSTTPDSFIVFTAHYDHLGQMGDGIRFPGANDNASGTSMLLNLAKYYAVNPPAYSVAFLFFSGEELGLLGSQYYVSQPSFPLDKIRFLINLDIVGTGEEGIKVVNATEFKSQFDQLIALNDKEQLLKVVSPRGKAANSDHYPFFEKGVPCFFIYTMGGIAAYHDVLDLPQTLPLTAYENLMKLLIGFTELQQQ